MNEGQEAFRRFTKQLRTVGGSGGGGGPGGRGLFAGSGLLIALVAGGFALNASLFNGAYHSFKVSVFLTDIMSQWMVVTVLSSTAGILVHHSYN